MKISHILLAGTLLLLLAGSIYLGWSYGSAPAQKPETKTAVTNDGTIVQIATGTITVVQ